MYLFLLAIIYLAFISLGLPDSLLGSAWPVMQDAFNVPISYMGIVTMIICGCTIVSSLVSDRLTRKLGTKYVTIISVFMTAVALFGFSLSNNFVHLCLWSLPYGFGAGCIDAALNNYVALHYNSRHMSWLHCFWGVGTIFSPYIMRWALSNTSWNSGYRIVSYVQLGITLVLVATLFAWKANVSSETVATEGKPVGIKEALKIKGVPYLLIGFFAYCAAEGTAMVWASSYLVEARGVGKETAAGFAALFYIGITAGRFASGFISEKLGDKNMIRLGTLVALVGVVLLVLPISHNLPSLVGLVVIGVGCAPVYPSIIHSTPGNFGAENSQAIIGIQMASAYVGSTFIPPLFGLIANHIDIKLFPWYILIFFVLMIVMTEKTFKKVGR